MNLGDWGLGIGDWGLPNPQSPIPNPQIVLVIVYKIILKYINCIK